MARNTKTLILIVVAVVLFFVFTSLFASSRGTLTQTTADQIKSRWGSDAQDASDFFGVPVSRILAMIGTESAGVEAARGTSGERGLMQLTRAAWDTVSDGVSYDDADDGKENIFAGTHYLKNLIDKYGNLDTATGHYNAVTLANRMIYVNKVRANENFF